MLDTNTNKIAYLGDTLDSLGIKKGDTETVVISKLAAAILELTKKIGELPATTSGVSSSDVQLTSQHTLNGIGKYSGTIDFTLVQNDFGSSNVGFDFSTFKNSISDNITSIETELFGTIDTNGRTSIVSSDKVNSGVNIENARYPLYGTSKVKVWENGSEKTYQTNITIPSGNIASYSFDYELVNVNQSSKTQDELNTQLVNEIARLRSQLELNPITIDDKTFGNTAQACNYLNGKCNAISAQVNNNSGTTIAAAKCGDSITTSGCVGC